jgi:hypothetical protein
MRTSGYEDYECLDFDLACMAWWDRFESMRQERKAVHESTQPRLGPKQVWGYRYATDKDVLDALTGVGVDALDPVLANVTADDLVDLMGDWGDFDA